MSAPPLSLKLVAAAALALAADSAPELTVLRVVPSEVASPGTVVTVTFDRPVAGSLDRTVALRAAGGPAGAPVRWTVDGSPHGGSRWALQPGRHRFRAVSAAGDSAEVTVNVE